MKIYFENPVLDDFIFALIWSGIAFALFLQFRIKLLYYEIVYEHSDWSDLIKFGTSDSMLSGFPFTGVIEERYKTKENQAMVSLRNRLCYLFWVSLLSPFALLALLVKIGVAKTAVVPVKESVTFLEIVDLISVMEKCM